MHEVQVLASLHAIQFAEQGVHALSANTYPTEVHAVQVVALAQSVHPTLHGEHNPLSTK